MNKLLVFVAILIFVSCGSDVKMQELDLITYGIPIKIQAPDSTDVIVKDRVVLKDVVIKQGKGDKYNIQLLFSDASTNDAVSLLAEKRTEQESSPYFSKFVKEDPDGFIYESRIDSNTITYGFTRVKVKAGKEFVFESAMIGLFKLEDIEKMYESVK